jgi:glutathione synthase/RimK-type ligase-like ATP-grasp enzyme
MKKIGFSKKTQGVFSQDVIEKIKKNVADQCNCTVVDVDFRKSIVINDQVFVDNICLNDCSVYFWHDTVYPRNWGADNYFLHALSVLENTTKVINSSESTRIVNDKFLAHIALKRNNVPVGDFALACADDEIGLRKVFESFGKDVLLKPRFGGWGIGIARAKKIDELLSITEYVSSFTKDPRQIMLIEKFHQNDLSRWVSVVMIGQKILFGYQKPLIGDANWKIYDPKKIDGKGERSIYIDPPQEAKEIALAAQKAIGKDIIGFDMIFTDEGYKIIDENGRPGLYQHCLDAAGISVENEIISLICEKMESM